MLVLDLSWLPPLERTAAWMPAVMPSGARARLVGRPLRFRYLGDGENRWRTVGAHGVRRAPVVLVAPMHELVFAPEARTVLVAAEPAPPEPGHGNAPPHPPASNRPPTPRP